MAHRTLFLIRHAKSSWDPPGIDDFHRPLNQRGLRDAPAMARHLKTQDCEADSVLSSPAFRALNTAALFLQANFAPHPALEVIPQLYHAEYPTILKTLRDRPASDQKVAIVGHNPGLSDFLRWISNTNYEDLPTCGIAHLAIPCPWNELVPGSGEVIAQYFPKQILPTPQND